MVIAVFLVALILLQQRGAGLGGAFGGGGGGGSEGGIYYKKRGMEKLIFTASIILAILFILTAFIRMLI